MGRKYDKGQKKADEAELKAWELRKEWRKAQAEAKKLEDEYLEKGWDRDLAIRWHKAVQAEENAKHYEKQAAKKAEAARKALAQINPDD